MKTITKQFITAAVIATLNLWLETWNCFAQWSQLQKIVASDREEFDYWGNSVSISGNYAIVGDNKEYHDATGGNTMSDAGSAYIFERISGNWTQVQKIVASDRAIGDWFGVSVSISGNYAIVGANTEDHDVTGGNYMSNSGSAYIFERISGNWTQVQKIVASDRAIGDIFGYKVSISGNYAIVGAAYEDEDAVGGNTMNAAGSAYIFERISGNWTQMQKITASDRGAGDQFGNSVSISISDNCYDAYVIVGANTEDHDVTGGNYMNNSGSAYIFERISGNWTQVQKIVASDRAADDYFGWTVSISGNYTIVGAVYEDEDVSGGNTMSAAGSAYIFERNSGNWVQVQKIVASDRAAGDEFGQSVSISGNYVIVGANKENEDTLGGNYLWSAGSAYIFERISGAWAQIQKIVASDRGEGDEFGESVSISGNYAIAGAVWEDEDAAGGNTMVNSGSAYIFGTTSFVPIELLVTVTSTAILCNGQCTGTATANVSGCTQPYTYSWNTIPMQTTQTAIGLCDGTYTVTVTDAANSTGTATVSITQPAAFTVTTTIVNASCSNANGTATTSVNGGFPAYTYSWNNGQSASTATGLSAGNYTITVTDSNGCIQTATTIIGNTNGPIAIAGPDITITSGTSTMLTASGGGTYSWYPSIGLSCSACANPVASPTITTAYCVYVFDTSGCYDSACVTVFVESPCGNWYLPNAFSPNGDGENDVLKIHIGNIHCIKKFHIIIYDRWGENIYESTDKNFHWEGTYKDKLQNTAVFVYYMEAMFANGDKITRKGNISLVR